MLSLSNEQRKKVEENMGLVGKVIKDCVHTLSEGCIYDYDDLYQIGCLGLCKAVQTERPDHEGAFSTYAYRLIRNEIYGQLEYATRRARELSTAPEELSCVTLDDDVEQTESCNALLALLDRAEAGASGVTAKGVQAIRMLADGYNSREIGEIFGVPANHVTAWVTKARKYIAGLC